MKKNNFSLNMITCCILSVTLMGCKNEPQATPSGTDFIPDPLVFTPSRYDVAVDNKVHRELFDLAAVEANAAAALPAALEIEQTRLEAHKTHLETEIARLEEEKASQQASPEPDQDKIDEINAELDVVTAELEAFDIDVRLTEFSQDFKADYRTSQYYDGNKKSFIFSPDDATVSGMSPLATHRFTLTSTDEVAVHEDDGCSFASKENSVAAGIAQLKVSSIADQRSVTMGDSLAFSFDIPENRYGVTYEAKLSYADKEHVFSITTPEAVKTPRMLEFYDANRVRVQPFFTPAEDDAVRDSSNLFIYDALTNEATYQTLNNTGVVTALVPTYDYIDENGNLLPVKPGQVYTFMTKKPVTGSSPFVRASLDFEHSPQTFMYTPYKVVNRKVIYGDPVEIDSVQVRAITKELGVQPYSGNCIAQDDFMAVSFHIPEGMYGETYTATLNWNYFDEEGNQVETPQKFEFSLTTEAEDTAPDRLSMEVFNTNSSNVEVGKYVYYELDVTGFNSATPISVDNAQYSVDGETFSNQPGLLPVGSRLVVRAMAHADGGGTTEHSITIGETPYSWSMTTALTATVDGFDAGLDFPATVSATLSDTVILRGHAYYKNAGAMSTAGISAANLLINGSMVDSYDANTGVWTKQVATPLEAGAMQTDHEFAVTVENITGTTVLSNSMAKVRRLSVAGSPFPADVTDYGSFTDVSVNQAAGALYIASSEIDQLLQLKLASDFDVLQVENKNSTDYIYKSLNAIQFNNKGPLDRRYVYKASGAQFDVTLAAPGFWLPQVSKDSKLNGPETVANPSQMVFDDAGAIIYLTGDAELAQVTPSYTIYDATDYFTAVPFRDNNRYPDSHKKTISNQFSSQSVDILTVGAEQYIVALSRVDKTNAGANAIWFIKKASTYNVETSATELVLVDQDGNPFALTAATSIAIDDAQKKAYVSNGGTQLVEVDLSQIAEGVTTAEATVKPFASTENAVGKITSVVMEGGLPYLVATDSTKNAVFAIDQYTGESVYLLQASMPVPVAPAP